MGVICASVPACKTQSGGGLMKSRDQNSKFERTTRIDLGGGGCTGEGECGRR